MVYMGLIRLVSLYFSFIAFVSTFVVNRLKRTN
jgi:hypothetical protein